MADNKVMEIIKKVLDFLQIIVTALGTVFGLKNNGKRLENNKQIK